jgi:multidrug efflux pump subunit AcrA (membrane-fusion protein)
LERAGQQYLVTPGMTVVADIKTGEKTLFEYLMKPIQRAVSESFREQQPIFG